MKQITTKTVYFNNRGELAEFATTTYEDIKPSSDVKTMAELEAESVDGFRNPEISEAEYAALRKMSKEKDDGYDYDKYY